MDKILNFEPNVGGAPKLQELKQAAKPREIDGQILITTPHGESVDLAPADISVYPADYLDSYVTWKRTIFDDRIEQVRLALNELTELNFFDRRSILGKLEKMELTEWDYLSAAPSHSTCDTTGKFRLSIPFDGPYRVFATARPALEGSGKQEFYVWQLASNEIADTHALSLDNGNSSLLPSSKLTESDSPQFTDVTELSLVKRNPDGHNGELISVSAKAATIQENGGKTFFQALAFGGNLSLIVSMPGKLDDLSEDDTVYVLGFVKGQSVGTNTYGGPVISIVLDAVAVQTVKTAGYLHWRTGEEERAHLWSEGKLKL